jgi:hypothetical protein
VYIYIVSLCILLFLYVSLCFFASINDTHTHEDINRLTHVPQATQINFANELGPVDIQPVLK